MKYGNNSSEARIIFASAASFCSVSVISGPSSLGSSFSPRAKIALLMKKACTLAGNGSATASQASEK